MDALGYEPNTMADHAASEHSDAGLRHVFVRPRLVAMLCVAVLAAAGWIYLGLMLAGELRHGAALGPGMEIFGPMRVDALGRALFDALCRPGFVSAHAQPAGTALGVALIWLMWSAMALAMMLPTAGPMIMTYADIAETARHKGEAVVSPAVLAAGYVLVWLGFAAGATGLQWVLGHLAFRDPGIATAGGLFSGAVFLTAGAYQFSALKHACVTLCQRPFPFFFANWTTQAGGVFRLGLRQGAYCVGCCWAMTPTASMTSIMAQQQPTQ